MNIFKLKIKNYKSIKDSGEIEIDNRIMAFIGQNNAGKSAILDAIQCVFPSVKKVVSKSDFHKGTHDNIEITVWFNGLTDDYIEDKLFSDAIFKLVDKARKLEDDNDTKAENAWKKSKKHESRNLQKPKNFIRLQMIQCALS